MTVAEAKVLTRREKLVQTGALAFLLLLAGMALFGPSGLLAWSENLATLDKRHADIKALTAQRDELQNRVALLNPDHVDPDLAGELIRKNLNVVHPDEVVIKLN